MPKEVFTKDYQFLPREALLSFEEIEQLVKSIIPLGVRKLRITGGSHFFVSRLKTSLHGLPN
jgi:GTP cyclohydrolase subunit MoaA